MFGWIKTLLSDKNAVLGAKILEDLASLPDIITVSHSPNPVKAQRGGDSGYKHTWQFTTTVAAQSSQIVIEEFGSFTWHKNQWVFSNYTGEPFTTDDFADWYGCPGATLTVGDSFADHTNWSGNDILAAGKSKWYFIGHTESGTRVKGEAIIETLAEVQLKRHGLSKRR